LFPMSILSFHVPLFASSFLFILSSFYFFLSFSCFILLFICSLLSCCMIGNNCAVCTVPALCSADFSNSKLWSDEKWN
jgi:hypothetical protein